MINLNEVGALVSVITNLGVNVRFGVYLPSIRIEDGYEVLVRVIHKDDRIQQPVSMPVAPFQYLESHDHSQLIYFVGTEAGTTDPDNIPFGDRSKFYKLQPFVIALYTCQGTPMLWQGQEFAENYFLPNSGNGRIRLRRDVHWEYFYDDFGAPLVRLYRTLGKLKHCSERKKLY